MAETNKSQMLSEAEIITAINADSLISVSLGAGQPQKNVKMSTLASVVAGLFPLASPTSNGLMSSELATLFTIKNAYNDTGTVTLNIGRQRGPIWAYSKSLGGNRTVCFIAKDSGVDFLGSSLDNSVLRNNITATLVNEEVLITAKTESGGGYVNVYAFYVGS